MMGVFRGRTVAYAKKQLLKEFWSVPYQTQEH